MKISSILIFMLILVTLIYSSIVSGKLNELETADDEIENVIIMNGLQTDSEKLNVNDNFETSRGKIIYDDSFDDTIIDPADVENKKNRIIRKRKNRKSTIKSKNIKASLMEQLRRKDRRWHLTPHTIKNGENLIRISKKYNTDYKLIIKANNIRNPNILKTGDTINIPNKIGINYIIRKGDTLHWISEKFGADIKKLLLYNNIRRDLIKVGQSIFIPDVIKKKIIKRSDKIKNNNYKTQKVYKTNKFMFLRPLKGKITSAFGRRVDPLTRKQRFHCGVDIGAKFGTPIKASACGKVIFSGWKNRYGRIVILKHKNNYITVYAHNKKNLVKENDIVKRGEVIAHSGMSGAVTGPHLHFEIRKYLTPLNPLRFLR